MFECISFREAEGRKWLTLQEKKLSLKGIKILLLETNFIDHTVVWFTNLEFVFGVQPWHKPNL